MTPLQHAEQEHEPGEGEGQMRERIQIWMSREHFLALMQCLQRSGPVGDLSYDGGPLEELHVAVEDAYNNNANWEPG